MFGWVRRFIFNSGADQNPSPEGRISIVACRQPVPMPPGPTSKETVETAYQCRFCEQPIRPQSGVLAAAHLAHRAQPSGDPLPVYGTPERFHALCAPANYRIDERF